MQPPLKLCMIAGERSGDFHASTVAASIRRSLPDAEIFGMGGRRMREAGVEVVHDMTEIAVVGFLEVLRNLAAFRSIFHDMLRIVGERKPDAVMLVDLPGFNLRFGPKVRKLGIPVAYYISPQTWAWGRRRTRKMRRFIDRFFVILPFEVEFYRRENIDAEFVGHPLVDILGTEYSRDEFRRMLGVEDSEKIVSLMPGSREQEIERMLPLMAETAAVIREKVPNARFIVPAASEHLAGMCERMLSGSKTRIDVRTGGVYDIMNASDAAVVSSGTATLEMGWFGVPFVLVYRMRLLSYLIARSVATVDRIGLLNILAGRTMATEYIQGKAKPKMVAEEITRFLTDEKAASEKRNDLLRVREMLGPGGAGDRVARGIIEMVEACRRTR